jgi:hypothetical protein
MIGYKRRDTKDPLLKSRLWLALLPNGDLTVSYLLGKIGRKMVGLLGARIAGKAMYPYTTTEISRQLTLGASPVC